MLAQLGDDTDSCENQGLEQPEPAVFFVGFGDNFFGQLGEEVVTLAVGKVDVEQHDVGRFLLDVFAGRGQVSHHDGAEAIHGHQGGEGFEGVAVVFDQQGGELGGLRGCHGAGL